jgi:hypothetical protein
VSDTYVAVKKKKKRWEDENDVLLTPKFLMCFLPNSAVSDIVEEMVFSKNQNMRTYGNKYRIFELPCWTSTSKSDSLSFNVIHEIIAFKHQSFFLLGSF